MRSLVLAVIMLLLGSLLTLMAVNASRQATAYPNAMMAVLAAQMKALDSSVKQQSCEVATVTRRMQSMRLLASDLELAFSPSGDDRQFAADSASLLTALDSALNAAPTTCAQLNATLDKINAVCHDCHRDFRD